MAHSRTPFSFSLYLSILLKLKFTPVRDHFPKCSGSKIKWTKGKNSIPSHNDHKTFSTSANAARTFNNKGNYCGSLECCQISPTDKPLTMTSRLETKHDLVCETFKDHTKLRKAARVLTLNAGDLGFGATTVLLICCLHGIWISCCSFK